MRTLLIATALFLSPGIALADTAADPTLVTGWGTAGDATPAVVGWEQLVPDRPPLKDPLAGVDMWVQYDLGFVVKVLADAENGIISRNSGEYRMAMQVLDSLRADGMDVDQMLGDLAQRDAAIARRKLETNADLDGVYVRIPGYALPMAASEDGVHEFLLVPYVGACIHYPPPPPNQVVLAKLETAHQFTHRFEIVWITGRLSAVSSTSGLDYVDGNAMVPTSWSMFVDQIEPYSADPSAETSQGNFSPIVAGPQLDLSRSGQRHRPMGLTPQQN